jgi:hypothetical protein
MFLKCGKRDGIEDSLNLPPLPATGLNELEPRNLHEIKCIDGYEIKQGTIGTLSFPQVVVGESNPHILNWLRRGFREKAGIFLFLSSFLDLRNPIRGHI